jgi:hypothetical protein
VVGREGGVTWSFSTVISRRVTGNRLTGRWSIESEGEELVVGSRVNNGGEYNEKRV